jgi:hypothetical protein
MVGIYFKTNHMPVRFLIYVAMTALTRLMIADIQHNHTPDDGIILVSVALLLLALAILVVRYASSRFPSPPTSKGGEIGRRPTTSAEISSLPAPARGELADALPSADRAAEEDPHDEGWKLFAPLLILVIVAITLYLQLHTQPLLLQGEGGRHRSDSRVQGQGPGRTPARAAWRRGEEGRSADQPEQPGIAGPAGFPARRAQPGPGAARRVRAWHPRGNLARCRPACRPRPNCATPNSITSATRTRRARLRLQSQLDLSRPRCGAQPCRRSPGQSGPGQSRRPEETRKALSAAVRRADAQLAELEAQSDDLKVLAPVDGEVGPIRRKRAS